MQICIARNIIDEGGRCRLCSKTYFGGKAYLKLTAFDHIKLRGSKAPVSLLYKYLSSQDLAFIHLRNGLSLDRRLELVE